MTTITCKNSILNVASKVFNRRAFSTSRALLTTQMTVRDALNSALDEELANDDRVFILGKVSFFSRQTHSVNHVTQHTCSQYTEITLFFIRINLTNYHSTEP